MNVLGKCYIFFYLVNNSLFWIKIVYRCVENLFSQMLKNICNIKKFEKRILCCSVFLKDQNCISWTCISIYVSCFKNRNLKACPRPCVLNIRLIWHSNTAWRWLKVRAIQTRNFKKQNYIVLCILEIQFWYYKKPK